MTSRRTRLFWIPLGDDVAPKATAQDTAEASHQVESPDDLSPESLVPKGPDPGTLEAMLEDEAVRLLLARRPVRWRNRKKSSDS